MPLGDNIGREGGRSCCGLSVSSVLEFEFQLDSLAYTHVVDHIILSSNLGKIRLAPGFPESIA
jgi:hypothetical protein